MKDINCKFPIVCSFLIFLCLSCKKNIENSSKSSLNFTDHAYVEYPNLAINQAVFIVDSSQNSWPDSSYRIPGIYYKWQATPANGCDSLVDPNGYGSVWAIFHCSGDYQVFASIYDSSTNDIIGYTDSVTLHVNNDTLEQYIPLREDDILKVDLKDWYSYPFNSDSGYLWFSLNTTDTYSLFNPTNIAHTDSITNNNFYSFFTGLVVPNYPYFINGSTKSSYTDWGVLQVPFYFGDDSIKNIHLTWLGKTYDGYIERTPTQYIVHWNYTNGVIFLNKEIDR